VIAAFVICEFGFNESRLINLAKQHLARYKQPRMVQRVTSLPRNANGKLIRAALPQLWNSK
jgi:acyl-coenzyme A synthetase/AMP-(fatty) acid ligase